MLAVEHEALEPLVGLVVERRIAEQVGEQRPDRLGRQRDLAHRVLGLGLAPYPLPADLDELLVHAKRPPIPVFVVHEVLAFGGHELAPPRRCIGGDEYERLPPLRERCHDRVELGWGEHLHLRPRQFADVHPGRRVASQAAVVHRPVQQESDQLERFLTLPCPAPPGELGNQASRPVLPPHPRRNGGAQR
jgi:hypothetical protein